jgi:hypothetical protein
MELNYSNEYLSIKILKSTLGFLINRTLSCDLLFNSKQIYFLIYCLVSCYCPKQIKKHHIVGAYNMNTACKANHKRNDLS